MVGALYDGEEMVIEKIIMSFTSLTKMVISHRLSSFFLCISEPTVLDLL